MATYAVGYHSRKLANILKFPDFQLIIAAHQIVQGYNENNFHNAIVSKW